MHGEPEAIGDHVRGGPAGHAVERADLLQADHVGRERLELIEREREPSVERRFDPPQIERDHAERRPERRRHLCAVLSHGAIAADRGAQGRVIESRARAAAIKASRTAGSSGCGGDAGALGVARAHGGPDSMTVSTEASSGRTSCQPSGSVIV